MLRPLREMGGPLVHSLPQCTKDLLKDVGICHYMTVFKAPDGRLLQVRQSLLHKRESYVKNPSVFRVGYPLQAIRR